MQGLAEKAVQDRKSKAAITKLSCNDPFGQAHFNILKEYLDNSKLQNKLRLVFVQSEQISMPGIHQFFDVLSNDTYNREVNMGDDGRIKVIDRITCRFRPYFYTNLFPFF